MFTPPGLECSRSAAGWVHDRTIHHHEQEGTTMHTYEFMNTMVAGRRAELEAAARRSRMATRRSLRSWFRQRSARAERVRSETTLVARTVPVAGTAEFHTWASSVGIQLAQGGAASVEGHL